MPNQNRREGAQASNTRLTKPRDRRFSWVNHDGTKLHSVGILADGTVWNPNKYPEETVRAAVLAAVERRHVRRSNAAKQAAETRRERRQVKVYAVARRLAAGQDGPGPRRRCYFCSLPLTDAQSIRRGIGSECWQGVLAIITTIRARETAE